jgi:hypothetical protein
MQIFVVRRLHILSTRGDEAARSVSVRFSATRRRDLLGAFRRVGYSSSIKLPIAIQFLPLKRRN